MEAQDAPFGGRELLNPLTALLSQSHCLRQQVVHLFVAYLSIIAALS